MIGLGFLKALLAPVLRWAAVYLLGRHSQAQADALRDEQHAYDTYVDTTRRMQDADRSAGDADADADWLRDYARRDK